MPAEHSPRFDLVRLSNDSEVARAAANQWLDSVKLSNEQGEPQRIALSGGRIARQFFNEIVVGTKDRGISLTEVHFFWADERCVPPDNPEGNFALANKFLFQPLSISANQIHRIRGEENPQMAARSASAEILRHVPADRSGFPVLDIVFLGMGEDGHVASLFPNVAIEGDATTEVYLSVIAPKPPPNRVSLSYGALRAAREVWVLASGVSKEKALALSLAEEGTTPLARVLRLRSRTTVFTDISLPKGTI